MRVPILDLPPGRTAGGATAASRRRPTSGFRGPTRRAARHSPTSRGTPPRPEAAGRTRPARSSACRPSACRPRSGRGADRRHHGCEGRSIEEGERTPATGRGCRTRMSSSSGTSRPPRGSCSNSSPVNGSVGFWWNFGGFNVPTGFSSTHFMPTQNRKNDRSRSSFFRAEIGESVQLARNFTMLSPVSCEMYLTPISSAKAVSRRQQDLLLGDRGVGQVPGRDVLEKSADRVLDADEGGVRALALPFPEEVLAGFPGAHVERPPNLLAPKRSLDPERALAASMLAAFGPVAAVREMPPEAGSAPQRVSHVIHTWRF